MFAAIALAGCASGPSPSADLLPPSARTKSPAPPSYTRQHQQMDDLARDGARLMQDAGRLRGGGD